MKQARTIVGPVINDLIRRSTERSIMFWQCKRILSNWLRDSARADQSNRYTSTNNLAVFQNLNLLQIASIDSLRDAGRLATVTAQVLRFAAFDLRVAASWLQVSVQFEDCSSLDSLVLLESTHGNKSFS